VARSKKLYYDVVLAGAGASTATISPTLTADRDGGILDAVPALDGNAEANAKQSQELSVFFHQYENAPDAAFALVGINDLPGGNAYQFPFDEPPEGSEYRIGSLQVNSSWGPGIELVFSRDVDPASLTTLQTEQEPDATNPPVPAGPESMFIYYDFVAVAAVPLVVAVVGNTITITRADASQWGTGPDPFNPIPGTGGIIGIHLTAALTDTDGNALINPGNVFWSEYITDD
jgi:hypothetical protein